MREPLLQVKDFTYRSKKPEKEILKNISFDFYAGSSLTIIGPNGAGKTTLLKSIAGLLKKNEGSIFLNGKPIPQYTARELGQLISFVPQRPIFPTQMKLLDYVLLGRTSHIPLFGKESNADLDIVHQAIQKTGMEWATSRLLHTLSGGELQLAVIARALTSQAPLLLFDEPTASLDLKHCYKLCQLIYDLTAQNSISFITTMHDLQLASSFADEMLLLHNGQIGVSGTASQVLTAENIEIYYGIEVKTETIGDRIFIQPQITANI